LKAGEGALDFTVLAALWGASFLFMRLSVGEFGPVALAGVRVAGAALFLAPLLSLRGLWPDLRQHWRMVAWVGLGNSALPFLAYSYAALSVTAGVAGIFNAASPLWATVIAWAWLGKRPTRSQTLGLAIGFAGVAWLAWLTTDGASFKPDASGVATGLAVLACIGATVLYGGAANLTREKLQGVPPLVVAAGSQLAAAVMLALPTWWTWPAQTPSMKAWWAAILLAVVCTGLAYILYFRLIARLGATRAITVTFLIPVFAVLWGWVFLSEPVTPTMLIGCAVILVGTTLALGLVELPSSKKQNQPAG
jgi:drug/metabolite transporter (DMT)-like permease